MIDKTCGTCEHAHYDIVYCRHTKGRHSGLHSAKEPGCREHRERTDSVEQLGLMERSYIVTIDPAYADLETFEEVYDAKEVVRCKECSHLRMMGIAVLQREEKSQDD